MFVVRPRPFCDESLTSYLQRVCAENYTNALSLWKELQRNSSRYPGSNDSAIIDYCPNKIFNLNKLAFPLGLTIDDVKALTFTRVVYNLTGAKTDHSTSRILSGELNSTRRFCPICLAENGYYKLMWQVREVEVCLDHGIYLLDKCPGCNGPIQCLYPWSQVGFCKCGYDLRKIKTPVIANELVMAQQRRYWQDWLELMGDLPALNFRDIKVKQILAAKLLFIANDLNQKFDGIRKIDVGLESGTVASLLQNARGTKQHNTFTHVRTIMTVLRAKGLSVSEFFNLEVPETFFESLKRTEPKRSALSYYCIAPWCKSYQKSSSLEKTGTVSKENSDGVRLKSHFFCTDCGIEYAVDEAGRVIERGYFIDLGWNKVRSLLLEGISQRNIAQKLGVSLDKVLRCIAYLAGNGLLPEGLAKAFLGKPEDHRVTQTVTNLIKQQMPIKNIQRQLKATYPEFLFYRYKTEVIREINNIHKIYPPRINTDDNWMTARALLEEMLKKNELITIKALAHNLNICNETLRNWGVLPLIADYKKQQQEKRDKLKIEELKASAEAIISSMANEGVTVESDTVYKRLGTRRTVLVRKYPEVTKYIGGLLRNRRELDQSLKVGEYISIVKELTEGAATCGSIITIEDAAEALELSVAGVSRYPELVKIIREARWH